MNIQPCFLPARASKQFLFKLPGSLALGWIGEPAVAHLLEGPLQGLASEAVLQTIFAVAFSVITFLRIALDELAPKTLALERAEKAALAMTL